MITFSFLVQYTALMFATIAGTTCIFRWATITPTDPIREVSLFQRVLLVHTGYYVSLLERCPQCYVYTGFRDLKM